MKKSKRRISSAFVSVDFALLFIVMRPARLLELCITAAILEYT